MGVTRIDQLTDDQRARFEEWGDKWIEIGLRTGPADRAKFEQAVQDCYRFAGIPWPAVVVWVPSPMVMALAAPTAALVIESILASRAAKAPRGRGLTAAEVDEAVRGAVGEAVHGVIRRAWSNYFGGQFWPGGYWWGGAFTSFFREVCGLDLQGDLWDRGKAYEATIQSACWWWPHRRFVMVCARPLAIHRELVNPSIQRGWGSHRLHCDTGPAVVWPDGWGVYAWHGIRVPRHVIDAPETITAAQVKAEDNTEVRRVMLARMGEDRFVRESGAKPIHSDTCGVLYDFGDETLAVKVINSTAEPDGSFKPYWLYVHPELRPLHMKETGEVEIGEPQAMTARNAVASTFGLTGDAYVPAQET